MPVKRRLCWAVLGYCRGCRGCHGLSWEPLGLSWRWCAAGSGASIPFAATCTGLLSLLPCRCCLLSACLVPLLSLPAVLGCPLPLSVCLGCCLSSVCTLQPLEYLPAVLSSSASAVLSCLPLLSSRGSVCLSWVLSVPLEPLHLQQAATLPDR